MAQLKVRQIGNSLGVVLPKETLARLNLQEGDALYLTEAPDGSMRITPYDPAFDTQMRSRVKAWASSATRCANSPSDRALLKVRR